MREIKFRAWDSETEEMYYTGESFDIIFYFDSEGIVAERVTEDETEKLEHLEYMAYTGLKDKNGKEIYEKDILYDPVTNDFYVVTWDDSYAMFFLKNTKEDADTRDYDFVEYDTKVGNDLYIVGNVYENPELLNS